MVQESVVSLPSMGVHASLPTHTVLSETGTAKSVPDSEMCHSVSFDAVTVASVRVGLPDVSYAIEQVPAKVALAAPLAAPVMHSIWEKVVATALHGVPSTLMSRSPSLSVKPSPVRVSRVPPAIDWGRWRWRWRLRRHRPSQHDGGECAALDAVVYERDSLLERCQPLESVEHEAQRLAFSVGVDGDPKQVLALVRSEGLTSKRR
jgi:hypothetical protein